jgi:enoyl-CoA hydratase/carnithine racemase
MNALTKAARYNHRRETVTNYIIAAVAGIVLGVMFGLSV